MVLHSDLCYIISQIEAKINSRLSQSPNDGILPTARKGTLEAYFVGFGYRLRAHSSAFGYLRIQLLDHGAALPAPSP